MWMTLWVAVVRHVCYTEKLSIIQITVVTTTTTTLMHDYDCVWWIFLHEIVIFFLSRYLYGILFMNWECKEFGHLIDSTGMLFRTRSNVKKRICLGLYIFLPIFFSIMKYHELKYHEYHDVINHCMLFFIRTMVFNVKAIEYGA